jgi:hypothetical protein
MLEFYYGSCKIGVYFLKFLVYLQEILIIGINHYPQFLHAELLCLIVLQ